VHRYSLEWGKGSALAVGMTNVASEAAAIKTAGLRIENAYLRIRKFGRAAPDRQ
jgi:hypothetical protein